jgi:adenylate cyclase
LPVGFGMTDATNTVPAFETDEIRRLIKAVNTLESQLREQRAMLNKQGMSLPPGTLPALQQVRAELETLTRHYEDTQLELRRLRELRRTAEVVNSTLDPDSVLNEVMDTVIYLTRAERGYLMLRNLETGALEFRVARNIEHRTLEEGEFVISNTVVAEVAKTGVPVVTTNAGEDPRFSAHMSIVSYALRSILCVPLLLKGEVTGVVYADNRIKQGLFGEKELELLQAFANQAAVAIENARLFERLQASLQEITAMKDLLDNVFASIASGVITTDSQNRITQLNDAACRILHLDGQACLGKYIWEVWPELHERALTQIREHNLEETVEIDTQIQDRGTANLSLKLSPLRDSANITQGVAIVVDDLTALKQREAQLNVVRRYLPPAMVDNIQNIDKLGLGGERRTITTIFIDVRGFNTFSPSLSPQEFMKMLNRYLTIASEAVSQQNGVIDKYMANEIMGLFNTQLNPSEDHAWRALLAALNMADEYMQFYRQSGELESTCYYRVGIHMGVATLGNVGSEHRREFTAIGDSINLAHRLLENARPGEIVISEESMRECEAQFERIPQRARIIAHEQLQVKGRRELTWVYRVGRGSTL